MLPQEAAVKHFTLNFQLSCGSLFKFFRNLDFPDRSVLDNQFLTIYTWINVLGRGPHGVLWKHIMAVLVR